MRALTVTNATVVDLMAEDTPFLPGSTVVLLGAAGQILEESANGSTGWANVATIPTGTIGVTAVLNEQYVRTKTSGSTILVGF